VGVGIVHDLDVITYGLAQRGIALVDVAQLFMGDFGTSCLEDGYAGFERVETLRQNALGVVYHSRDVPAAEMGVDRYLGAARAAQERADRGVEGLAFQVPQGLVDAADGAGEHHATGAVAGGAAGVEIEVNALDVEGVPADDVLLEVGDHGRDGLLVGVGGFADATEAFVGVHVYMGPFAAAVRLDQFDGDLCDFHAALL